MEDDSTIRLEPSDLKLFRDNITRWQKLGHECQRSGDIELASLYAEDVQDLQKILNLLGRRDYRAARKAIDDLDTIVRDQIPPDIYYAVTR
ncbi:MAG: hypothetical protein IT445_06325 [Phycisphaeraceae bacterium]|nr:hypothetical protein [Phycisphaeraceae bacterium]